MNVINKRSDFKKTIFESERLRYTDHDISDLEFLASLLLNKDTMSFIPNKYENVFDIKEMLLKIDEDRKSKERTVFLYIVRNKEKDYPIGIVSLKHIKDQDTDEGVLGYIIKREYCGNGYAAEAAKSMVSYAFKELNIPEVSASTAVENVGSEKVLIKIGMKKEDSIENELLVNGRAFTEVYYRLNKQDF